MAAVAWCARGAAQDTGKAAEYRVYTLRYKPVAEVERMLTEMLADSGMETHLVTDPKSGQILLRGPEAAQAIARELIASVDRPPPRKTATKPVVEAYSCPADRLQEIAEGLRAFYANREGVRVATDPQGSRLLILAPPEVHDAIPGQLAALGAEGGGPQRAVQPSAGPTVRTEFVALSESQVDRVEDMLRQLFGPRLEAPESPQPGRLDYVFTNDAGQRVEVGIDRKRRGIMLFGPAGPVNQLVRLIHILDGSTSRQGRTVRVVPVPHSDPAKLRQAIEAYRSGYRDGARLRRLRPAPKGSDADGSSDSSTRGAKTGRYQPGSDDEVEFAAYLQRVRDGLGPSDGEAPPEAKTGEPGEEEEPGVPLRELGPDVEIETLPDLDVIILRGREPDVEEITRIIEEIERISAVTEPAIEVFPLRNVQGESLVEVITQVREDLIGGRGGRVSITPLVKPNALLLIGWGEAVDAIKTLIRKLDQPVAPQTQLRVFRLRQVAASAAATTTSEFFSDRGGLGTKVQVVADARSNSLIVRAAPRDMAELELLLQRLDTGQSDAVSRARFFKLKNSLAGDVAETLEAAIGAARGGAEGGRSAVLELLAKDPEGQRLVRSGILADVQITPDSRTNTLVVTGPAESMDLIAALIEQLDQPASVAQIKVFRIVNGDASSMVEMLRSLLPSQAGEVARAQLPGAEGETALVPLRFSVDARTNSIIATGSEGDLSIIEALILRLDEETAAERKTAVYRLKNKPAIDVATAVNNVLRSERQVELAAPGAESPFLQLEREVVVVPEPVGNTLILSATPRLFEEINKLIEELDAEPAKVMIQVVIAEVALGDTDEFGVELGLQDSVLFDRSLLSNIFTVTNTAQQSTEQGIITATEQIIRSAENTPGFLFNVPELGNSGSQSALNQSNKVGGQGLANFAVGRVNSELGFGGLVLSASSESVSVLIRALKECRRLEVLSRPQIMTLDNQSAWIQVGQRVPRIVGVSINQQGQVNNVDLEDVGLILGVTPRISPDGMVVMEVDAEKSEVGPEQEGIPVSISEGQTVRSPAIKITMASTTVSAMSGETIVLGGLITKSQQTTKRRVPWLSEIPIVGNVFRYDADVEKRTELLIILTPHVVRNPEDAQRIKETEASRINWCLGDVIRMQGDIGVHAIEQCNSFGDDIPMIMPLENPRGRIDEPEIIEPNVPRDGQGSTPGEPLRGGIEPRVLQPPVRSRPNHYAPQPGPERGEAQSRFRLVPQRGPPMPVSSHAGPGPGAAGVDPSGYYARYQVPRPVDAPPAGYRPPPRPVAQTGYVEAAPSRPLPEGTYYGQPIPSYLPYERNVPSPSYPTTSPAYR